jgi:hypothetical protein
VPGAVRPDEAYPASTGDFDYFLLGFSPIFARFGKPA